MTINIPSVPFNIPARILDVSGVEQSVANAATSATQAGTEADRAEVARDAATVNADLKDDIADGLATTAVGDQFVVDGSVEYIRYRHDAGPVAVEVARYPAASNFSQGIGYITGELTPIVGGIQDDQDRYALAVLSDGTILANLALDAGANGLTIAQNPISRRYSIGLGEVSGEVPVGDSGQKIDTRETEKYREGKRILWDVSDDLGRLPFWVADNGEVRIPNLRVDSFAIGSDEPVVDESNAIICFGDSLTAGTAEMGGVFYHNELATAIGRSVARNAVGGETSSQIAFRHGSRVLDVTFAGNEIVSGNNVISAIDGNAIVAYTSGAFVLDIPVTIGVTSGRLRSTDQFAPGGSSYPYVFIPDAGQALPVTCPPRSPMVVNNRTQMDRINIIWAGRNTPERWGGGINEADIDLMVSRLHAVGNKRILILSVLNGNYSNEFAGTSLYGDLIQLNRNLQKKYPDYFVDIRRWLIDRGLIVAGITPTAQDEIDIGRDVYPQSLRADDIHQNATANQIIGPFLANIIIGKGW